MARFVAAVYTQASRLYYEDHVFSLTSGVHQGDPLAGLLFSLTLHAFLFKVHNIIPNLQLNAWYLDDGKIVSTLNDMSRAVQMFVNDGPEHDLHLDLHKSLIMNDVDAIDLWCLFSASIKFKTFDDSQKTFGCSIGPDLYVQDFIKTKIDNIELILNRISYINNPRTEMIILRGSANSSKINHLLRTVRRDRIHDKLQSVDQNWQMAIEAILSAQIDDSLAWKQAHLPIGKAGLAIGIVEDHPDAAYINSRLGIVGLVN
jgi:hypothetical protein